MFSTEFRSSSLNNTANGLPAIKTEENPPSLLGFGVGIVSTANCLYNLPSFAAGALSGIFLFAFAYDQAEKRNYAEFQEKLDTILHSDLSDKVKLVSDIALLYFSPSIQAYKKGTVLTISLGNAILHVHKNWEKEIQKENIEYQEKKSNGKWTEKEQFSKSIALLHKEIKRRKQKGISLEPLESLDLLFQKYKIENYIEELENYKAAPEYSEAEEMKKVGGNKAFEVCLKAMASEIFLKEQNAKKTYHKLAKQSHPDRIEGNHDRNLLFDFYENGYKAFFLSSNEDHSSLFSLISNLAQPTTKDNVTSLARKSFAYFFPNSHRQSIKSS